MAQIEAQPKIEMSVRFTVTESEARALEALACYGVDEFIKTFYTSLGKAYMERHETGLRSLLNSVKKDISPVLERINRAQSVLNDTAFSRP